jgi:hypothetical protein
MNRGAPTWFHNVWTYGRGVIEYGTKKLLKIHLNQIYSLLGNLGMFLVGKP